MPRRPSRPSTAPHVVVVGAGISGLTAALRLLQRGYRVTIYEQKAIVGGNLAGFEADGVAYDVYPHMFGNWYQNFWNLVEGDLGLMRGDGPNAAFQPRYTFKVLDRGKFPNFTDMLNVAPTASPWSYLLSGPGSPAEMFLWAYFVLDSLAYSLVDDDVLDRISVEGFLRSRAYATPQVAALQDLALMTIWSIHSDDTSAAAYRRFLEHNAPLPSPLLWLLTGNLGIKLMQPLKRKIEALGGTFNMNTCVVQIELKGGQGSTGPARIAALKIKATEFDEEYECHTVGDAKTVRLDGPGDALILAVSPTALGHLVTNGDPPNRIVDKVPSLSQVRRLAAEPIPVLNLFFKKKLPNIPKEHILLRGSRYDLTALDLEQIWHDDPKMYTKHGSRRTVLCVAASDYDALPTDSSQGQLHPIIGELREYLSFDRKDVDFQETYFDSNTNNELFLNSVGGKQWQPETHYPGAIANLFFGGDCAINPIRMATVESATVSGLQAASCVWTAHPLGRPIDIKVAPTLPQPIFAALKAWMAPWAYAAKWWSSASNILPHLARGDTAAAQASMRGAALDLYTAPWVMAVDVWQNLVRTAASPAARRSMSTATGRSTQPTR